MKTRNFKRYKAKDHQTPPEIMKTRFWVAGALGIAGGVGFAIAWESIIGGILIGALLFGFLMTRKSRVKGL